MALSARQLSELEPQMNRTTFSLNATVFTGIALMAFARVFCLPEIFAVGCGVMLLSASSGCLYQSKMVEGLRHHFIFGLGAFGMMSLPLVISATLIPGDFSVSLTLVGTLVASSVLVIASLSFWSLVANMYYARTPANSG